MNKQALRKFVKKNSPRYPSILYLFDVADKLKIKYELLEFSEVEKRTCYFKLSHKNRTIIAIDSFLNRNMNYISSQLAVRKDFIKNILKKKKIKVPAGVLVKSNFAEVKRAIIKNKLKFPLVIKPNKLLQGKGVFINLENWTMIRKAVNEINRLTNNKKIEIIAEEFFPGREFRFLVLNGKCIAVAERIPPRVKGDGKSSIQQLVKKQLRTKGLDTFKYNWEVEKTLKKQKATLKSVPGKDEYIYLRENTNMSTGGLSINRTKEACTSFKKIAEFCAKEFEMKLAGVDLLTSDVSDARADYRFLEINHDPLFYSIHDNPNFGTPENTLEKTLKYIFKLK